ncbi:MAG: D-alanine aminotransferase [Chlamydiae bacterium]|nr:D-alanine aminotransferase [Chlamydiota bacterium]
MTFAAIDGEILPSEDAKLPLDDLGFLRGLGVFENFRTYNKQPFRLMDRYEKLKGSGAAIGITLRYSYEEIEEMITSLIKRSHSEEVTLRLVLTGGSSNNGLTIDSISRFIILMRPMEKLPTRYTEEGLHLITTHLKRPFPTLKSLEYLSSILALKEAKDKGADDALYLNENQGILETTTANFFAFSRGKLLTTNSKEILPGITRKVILELQKNIEFETIDLADLPLLEEAFTSSSIKGILPVASINGHRIGNGKLGQQTKELISRFSAYAHQATLPSSHFA